MPKFIVQGGRPLRGTVRPDAQLKARYDQLFPIYVKARQAMPPVWADLARNRIH